MGIIDKANEFLAQISSFVNVSLPDVISSAFMRFVNFLVNLLLGL